MTARLPIYHGGEVVAHALVDADNLEHLSQWRWSLSRGYPRRNAALAGRQRTVYLHQEVAGVAPPGHVVDHISRDRLDARRENLRIVPRADHMQNLSAKRTGRSAFRGVSWCAQTQRWRAQIRLGGKARWLGRFDTEYEAAVVAAAARRDFYPYSEEARDAA